MATNTNGGAKGCTFQLNIENVSHCWWLKLGEAINSPAFIADVLEGTKWPEDCSGPENFEVKMQFSFLGKDGSILIEHDPLIRNFMKNKTYIFSTFVERERVFVTEKEAFIPEDTLIVQCTLWTTDEKPDKSNHVFATTVIKVKRRSFGWKIDKSRKRHEFRDYLIGFDVVPNTDFDGLHMDITPFDETIKYISCKTSIIDSEGRKENCEIKKYFPGDLKKGVLPSTLLFPKTVLENKSQYFPNDVLSLDFELVISTVEHLECRRNSVKLENEAAGKDKAKNTTVLNDDFKSLYNDGTFSDIELRSPTKTFAAHKAILSARSPVFRSMFSNDMKEKNSGNVDINDFEDDTIHRMLLYIYTDSLDDMQYEIACKLYAIADKYQISSLKSKCSLFLEENLCPINACEVLVLADLHHDDDLKRSVEDYVLRQNKFFCSPEWKDLLNSHVKLAADIMHRKIIKCMSLDA